MKHATTAAVPSGTQPMRARTSPTNPSSPQIRRARPLRPNTSHASCRLASRRLNAAGAQEEVVEEDAVAKEKRPLAPARAQLRARERLPFRTGTRERELATGERATGDRATGDRATGERATG